MTQKAPQLKATDSHRHAVRRLMRGARSGILAVLPDNMPTHGTCQGVPLTSLVTMATDGDGSPLFLFSTLADHTQALLKSPSCSLLVEDASHLANPQTGPRVSLCGAMERITDEAEITRVKQRFVTQNPGAAQYADFADFSPWRMRIDCAHYVGGFARAVWVQDGILVNADLVAAFEAALPALIDHMNQDHGTDIANYASAFLKPERFAANQWTLVSLDIDGMHLGYQGCERTFYLPFQSPLASVDECRGVLVEMAKRALQIVTEMAFNRG